MTTKNLSPEEITELIEAQTAKYFAAKTECERIDAAALREKREYQIAMSDAKEALEPYIGPGKLESVKTQAGTVHTIVRPSYTTKNRGELDEWILSPILTEVSEKVIHEVMRRLGVLSKTLSGEFCKEYRLDTGAEYATKTRITGGDLPPSVTVNENPAIGFRATGNKIDDEQGSNTG